MKHFIVLVMLLLFVPAFGQKKENKKNELAPVVISAPSQIVRAEVLRLYSDDGISLCGERADQMTFCTAQRKIPFQLGYTHLEYSFTFIEDSGHSTSVIAKLEKCDKNVFGMEIRSPKVPKKESDKLRERLIKLKDSLEHH
jgi:hypothetical protein